MADPRLGEVMEKGKMRIDKAAIESGLPYRPARMNTDLTFYSFNQWNLYA